MQKGRRIQIVIGRVACGLGCVFLLAPPAQAQSWCPPGAEWRYPYITLEPQYQPYGTLVCSYLGDTIFQGRPCTHISTTAYLKDHDGVFHELWQDHSFTEAMPDLIRLWNPHVEMFDTLARFDAPVGTTWLMHHYLGDKTVTVTATGTDTINGIALRYVKVVREPAVYGPPEDIIYERLGTLNTCSFMPWASYEPEPRIDPLRCYRDENWEYAISGYPSCNLLDVGIVGISEGSPTLNAWPNPGVDKLSLGWNSTGTFNLSILDSQGRTVLQQKYRNTDAPLNINKLSPGPYTLVVTSMNGQRAITKWIKQ